MLGTITDGDIRRAQLKFGVEIFNRTAADLMNTEPKTSRDSAFAVDAMKIMNKYRVGDIVIIDERNRPIGILDLKDFLSAGFL